MQRMNKTVVWFVPLSTTRHDKKIVLVKDEVGLVDNYAGFEHWIYFVSIPE